MENKKIEAACLGIEMVLLYFYYETFAWVIANYRDNPKSALFSGVHICLFLTFYVAYRLPFLGKSLFKITKTVMIAFLALSILSNFIGGYMSYVIPQATMLLCIIVISKYYKYE